MELKKDFFSNFCRINPLAVFYGLLVTLAFLYLSVSLAAGLGYWPFRLQEDQQMRESFWKAAGVAWVLSVSFGSFVAALSAHPDGILNGVLNSLTTWACSLLFFGGISVRMAGPNIEILNEIPTSQIFWYGFVADVGALGAAVVVGILAALAEKLKIRIDQKTDILASSTPILNKLDPAKY